MQDELRPEDLVGPRLLKKKKPKEVCGCCSSHVDTSLVPGPPNLVVHSREVWNPVIRYSLCMSVYLVQIKKTYKILFEGFVLFVG